MLTYQIIRAKKRGEKRMQKEIQRKSRCSACRLYLGYHTKEASGAPRGGK